MKLRQVSTKRLEELGVGEDRRLSPGMEEDDVLLL